MMVDAATVFAVTDIAKGTEHYRDVLGVTVTFGNGVYSLIRGRLRVKTGMRKADIRQVTYVG